MIIAHVSPAAGGNSRIVSIACNTYACDDNEEPQIMGSQTSYANSISGVLSADELPMVVLDVGANHPRMEFVQCQFADCDGARTVRTFPESAVGIGSLPRIAVAADGNPIMGFDRGGDRGYGILHCRDPECLDWRAH